MLEYFDFEFQKELKNIDLVQVVEIRIRANKNVIIKCNNTEIKLNYKPTINDIENILNKMCENSIYAYQEQICNGFITLPQGHRVGITGSVVQTENKVININYVSSLNIRICKEIRECSNTILKYTLDIGKNSIYNTIIMSPPGGGKTTIIRDFIRKISDGIDEINFKGITVGLVDERGEIASMYHGIPTHDIGIRTDVLENVSKDIGMRMLVRTMAPDVIVADEIGTKEDANAIHYAVCSGVKGIFTAHGDSMQELEKNPNLKELIDEKIIERIIFLQGGKNKGKIKEAYFLNNNIYQRF